MNHPRGSFALVMATTQCKPEVTKDLPSTTLELQIYAFKNVRRQLTAI